MRRGRGRVLRLIKWKEFEKVEGKEMEGLGKTTEGNIERRGRKASEGNDGVKRGESRFSRGKGWWRGVRIREKGKRLGRVRGKGNKEV